MSQNVWGPADPFKVKATEIKALGQPKATLPVDKTLETATAIGKGLSALYESDFGEGLMDTASNFLGSGSDTWGSRELKTLDTQLSAMDKHKPTVEGDELNKWQQSKNFLTDRRNFLVNSDQYKTEEDVVYGKPNWFDKLTGTKGVQEGVSVFDTYEPTQDFFPTTPPPADVTGDAGDGSNTGAPGENKPDVTAAAVTPDVFVTPGPNWTPNEVTEAGFQNSRFVNDGINTVKTTFKDAKFHVDSFFGGDLTTEQSLYNKNLKGFKSFLSSPKITTYFLDHKDEYAEFVKDPMGWYTTKGPGAPKK